MSNAFSVIEIKNKVCAHAWFIYNTFHSSLITFHQNTANAVHRVSFLHTAKYKTDDVRKMEHWGALTEQLLRWKNSKYYIFWVCECTRSLGYPASRAHAPYYIVICSLSGYTTFSTYLINHTILGNKLLKIKCVLILSTTFAWNISHSKKNWTRYKFHRSSCKVHVILNRF
jgi:hypothetical protein